MSESILHIEHLSKKLGNREILHDISFDAYAGEVFGFLGPNGAGKTTTIKIAAGLLTLDDGEISICGHSLRTEFEAAMANVGGIVENPEFYGYLSGLENLRQYAAMHDGVTKARVDEVVELVGLSSRIREPVKKYSLGMRQRLGLAQSLMHRPRLMILDEPTNGLDPASTKALRDILKRMAHEENCAVMVSSHLMSEMEMMCDRVGIIVGGTLRSVMPIEEMIAASSPDRAQFHLRVSDAEAGAALLGFLPEGAVNVPESNVIDVTLPTEGLDEALAQVNRTLIDGGISVYTVVPKENRKLEDVFIELTGQGGGQVG